jgi:hypothetical protein
MAIPFIERNGTGIQGIKGSRKNRGNNRMRLGPIKNPNLTESLYLVIISVHFWLIQSLRFPV